MHTKSDHNEIHIKFSQCCDASGAKRERRAGRRAFVRCDESKNWTYRYDASAPVNIEMYTYIWIKETASFAMIQGATALWTILLCNAEAGVVCSPRPCTLFLFYFRKYFKRNEIQYYKICSMQLLRLCRWQRINMDVANASFLIFHVYQGSAFVADYHVISWQQTYAKCKSVIILTNKFRIQ